MGLLTGSASGTSGAAPIESGSALIDLALARVRSSQFTGDKLVPRHFDNAAAALDGAVNYLDLNAGEWQYAAIVNTVDGGYDVVMLSSGGASSGTTVGAEGLQPAVAAIVSTDAIWEVIRRALAR